MLNLATSLDISRELEKAGWTKPTYFGWHNSAVVGITKYVLKDSTFGYDLPAPTAQEVAAVLPEALTIVRHTGVWNATAESYRLRVGHGESMTDALAKLWIKLRENK